MILKEIVKRYQGKYFLDKDGPLRIKKIVNDGENRFNVYCEFIDGFTGKIESDIFLCVGMPYLEKLKRITKSDFYNCLKNERIEL